MEALILEPLKAAVAAEGERYRASVHAKHSAIRDCEQAFALLSCRVEQLAQTQVDWTLPTAPCRESPTAVHVFPVREPAECLFCGAPRASK